MSGMSRLKKLTSRSLVSQELLSLPTVTNQPRRPVIQRRRQPGQPCSGAARFPPTFSSHERRCVRRCAADFLRSDIVGVTQRSNTVSAAKCYPEIEAGTRQTRCVSRASRNRNSPHPQLLVSCTPHRNRQRIARHSSHATPCDDPRHRHPEGLQEALVFEMALGETPCNRPSCRPIAPQLHPCAADLRLVASDEVGAASGQSAPLGEGTVAVVGPVEERLVVHCRRVSSPEERTLVRILDCATHPQQRQRQQETCAPSQ
mmetsp:Transcript_4202/g.11872  ORF Transcript_4202/g.11872 Transcript_4202/m.11872 type:complete len:259 (+) Transcript_4202:7-783(+)